MCLDKLSVRKDEKRWNHVKRLPNVQPIKGSVHIVVNRQFVDFILHNRTSLKILKWTKKTIIPDETFFSTLNFNPQLNINGSFPGSANEIKEFVNRYKVWYTKKLCAGRFRNEICILSTGDLPRLGTSKQLFANKFHIQTDRIVIGCLEEKLANDTRDEYACKKTFDTSYYSQLKYVEKQNRI
ncbi:N-acetyllactosaminide beta-1,6-N-acetylglucosaminyl-transferase [Bulinus truncatus]|nr:N-acetyllactosaminide beta-1,6-N-acetylglucosaminyl-transferase [Bulinus truncatus]